MNLIIELLQGFLILLILPGIILLIIWVGANWSKWVKTKYRIVETTRTNGEKIYDLQQKDFIFWWPVFTCFFNTKEEVITALKEEEGRQFVQERVFYEK